jgi:hypothetical protein
LNDLDSLLDRARAGALSSIDLNELVQRAAVTENIADKERILRIIGLSYNTAYRPFIEGYLSGDSDTLANIALDILCTDWGDTQRYRDVVLRMLRGVPWDRFELIRQTAASIAGEYLRMLFDAEMLGELVRILEDEREMKSMRQSAYVALARSIGADWKPLLILLGQQFDPDSADIEHVLNAAKKRLAGEWTS